MKGSFGGMHLIVEVECYTLVAMRKARLALLFAPVEVVDVILTVDIPPTVRVVVRQELNFRLVVRVIGVPLIETELDRLPIRFVLTHI